MCADFVSSYDLLSDEFAPNSDEMAALTVSKLVVVSPGGFQYTVDGKCNVRKTACSRLISDQTESIWS